MDIQIDFSLVDRIAEGPTWVYWWTRVIDYIDVARFIMGDTEF